MQSILRKVIFVNVEKDMGEGYYVAYRSVSNGMGGYQSVNLTINRYDDKWYYYEVSDKFGNFNDYPGEVSGKWEDELELPFFIAARFLLEMTKFEDGKCCVKWMVQPDGRYFEDEGFGGEDYEEIWLYAIMDTTGHFLTPFSEKDPFPDKNYVPLR